MDLRQDARTGRPDAPHRRRGAGFSLVEILISATFIVVALVAFATSIGHSLRVSRVDRERALAAEAAQAMLERLHGEPFRDVFRLYNDHPADDPDGPGSAPGARFDVAGLVAPAGAPRGMAGAIAFPTAGAPNVLREDVVDRLLGMPADLNADGDVDDADHAGDCVRLPVRIAVRWVGKSGVSELALHTTLLGL